MAMATETAMDVSIWDKLGDGFTAFQEGVGRWLTRLFGSSNERYTRNLGYIRPPRGQAEHTVISGSLLAQVNALEPQMQALTDDQLRGFAAQWREKLANGAKLDDL